MRKYGGSFVESLSICFRLADSENFKKLKEAFSEYWKQYEEMQKGNKIMDQCLNTQNYKLCPELQRNADSIRRSVDSCISLKEKPYSIKVKRTVFKIKPLK